MLTLQTGVDPGLRAGAAGSSAAAASGSGDPPSKGMDRIQGYMDTPDTIWINTADTAERTGSNQSRSPVVVDREYRADRDTVRLRAVRGSGAGK